MGRPRFLADTMLGSLAKKLRLLGIDTAYVRDADDKELRYIVRSQARVLLTRNVKLSKTLGDDAWTVAGGNVREEFLSIAARLSAACCCQKPLSRCIDCNEPINSISPSEAEGRVPPYILKSKNSFSMCPACKKVYWDGTHTERMEGEVKWMEGILEQVSEPRKK